MSQSYCRLSLKDTHIQHTYQSDPKQVALPPCALVSLSVSEDNCDYGYIIANSCKCLEQCRVHNLYL